MLFHGAVNPAHIRERIFYTEYAVMAPVWSFLQCRTSQYSEK